MARVVAVLPTVRIVRVQLGVVADEAAAAAATAVHGLPMRMVSAHAASASHRALRVPVGLTWMVNLARLIAASAASLLEHNRQLTRVSVNVAASALQIATATAATNTNTAEYRITRCRASTVATASSSTTTNTSTSTTATIWLRARVLIVHGRLHVVVLLVDGSVVVLSSSIATACIATSHKTHRVRLVSVNVNVRRMLPVLLARLLVELLLLLHALLLSIRLAIRSRLAAAIGQGELLQRVAARRGHERLLKLQRRLLMHE